ncbi:DUF3175 domain-containing protein [Roseomonas eburnea]|uniref:DUF3175 domain-containing protein n=1 Tax=Neoroseomonas eburnea TaxID=1346889 RepID=A0A9X9X866_9PROT|nr:DUF3175 domain-containing protein [Neoroseomonas eburnea]
MAETRNVPKGGSLWSAAVATASTFPPPGLFAQDAGTIAAIMARPDVSPGGLGAAIRMVTFFINRGGRAISASRRAELTRAKRLLRAQLKIAPVLPPGARRAGRYRHVALGAVRVVRRGRIWQMLRGDGAPPIPLGPDGWRYLRAA